MARENGIEFKDGITIGDARRWLSELDLPDAAILFGRVKIKGQVTKLSAREDRLKDAVS